MKTCTARLATKGWQQCANFVSANEKTNLCGIHRRRGVAYFYDNANHNRDEFNLCPRIIFNKVTDSGDVYISADEYVDYRFEDAQAWIEKLENPLAPFFFKAFEGDVGYDPQVGFVEKSGGKTLVDHVIEHVCHDPNVKAVIFDWDRTLQVMEGMLPTIESVNTIQQYFVDVGDMPVEVHFDFMKNMSIIHAGGKKRFHDLRKMFRALKKSKKDVYVLSASEAILSSKPLYMAIMKEWGYKIQEQNLLFSQDKYTDMGTKFKSKFGAFLDPMPKQVD